MLSSVTDELLSQVHGLPCLKSLWSPNVADFRRKFDYHCYKFRSKCTFFRRL